MQYGMIMEPIKADQRMMEFLVIRHVGAFDKVKYLCTEYEETVEYKASHFIVKKSRRKWKE